MFYSHESPPTPCSTSRKLSLLTRSQFLRLVRMESPLSGKKLGAYPLVFSCLLIYKARCDSWVKIKLEESPPEGHPRG